MFNFYDWMVDTLKLMQIIIGVGIPFGMIFYLGYVCGARRRVTKNFNVQNGSFPIMPGATVNMVGPNHE